VQGVAGSNPAVPIDSSEGTVGIYADGAFFVPAALCGFLCEFLCLSHALRNSSLSQLQRHASNCEDGFCIRLLVHFEERANVLPSVRCGNVLERQMLSLACPLPSVCVPETTVQLGEFGFLLGKPLSGELMEHQPASSKKLWVLVPDEVARRILAHLHGGWPSAAVVASSKCWRYTDFPHELAPDETLVKLVHQSKIYRTVA
jgi:hypothetical protein